MSASRPILASGGRTAFVRQSTNDPATEALMDDRFTVACPYCGEEVELYLEADVRGVLVQDCEVCCNPWRVLVARDGDARWVEVAKADGSE